MTTNYSKATAGTFTPNKFEPIHGWYKYLEGYSSQLIIDVIKEIGESNVRTIYDPFCGTGTTSLVASFFGIKSFYSETNPFMQKVIEAKINSVRRLQYSGVRSKFLKELLLRVEQYNYHTNFDQASWDGFEKYFDSDVLRQLLDLKTEVEKVADRDSKEIAEVLLAAVVVRASKMIRQGDLRFAKVSEKKDIDRDIVANFVAKLRVAINDIDNHENAICAETVCLDVDARNIDVVNTIDCVITSPPYLNGTNYIRNTKLELKLTGFIKTEKELPKFHSKGIISGINNVSKRKKEIKALDIVAPYLKMLEPVSYDNRIPVMVAGYFNDMNEVIMRLATAMKNDSYFIMDIGDSQFAGVHIPTHEILAKLCERNGFVLYDDEILRERRSKNGMVLSQRLMKFRLHKKIDKHQLFLNESQAFISGMFYKRLPYSGRNWGHPWHSLCSYHGKLKPSIAHFLVKNFTEPGDIVVDPLCGVGTIPLEACLQGRYGIGNDLSELAFLVTKAKVEKTTYDECIGVLQSLNHFIEIRKNTSAIGNQVSKYSSFGYNGKLPAYFHEETFREILVSREYFVSRIKSISSSEAMVFSCLLHVLHGNRPYALSRNSHPLTPYSPSGDYIYRNIVKHVKKKLDLVFNDHIIEGFSVGKAIFGDYSALGNYELQADAVISSPPFADSIRFYMQNWMRLWLCGWEEEDFQSADMDFLDQKQKKDFDVYSSFFQTCSSILKPNGKVILHLGKTKKVDMAEELSKRAQPFFREVFRGNEDVQGLEKHGIKDKGSTIEHQFLFLMKK